MEQLRISLAAARVNAGLTQDDVAKKMQVTKNTVVNWEKGRVIPSLSSVRMMSEIYQIPIDNIFLPAQST